MSDPGRGPSGMRTAAAVILLMALQVVCAPGRAVAGGGQPAGSDQPLPSPNSTDPEGSAAEPRMEAGRRIYREGVLPSGENLVAMSQGVVPLPGSQAACANCHRRSAQRSVEGGRIVPSITGKALFAAQSRGRIERPAYSMETLDRALRSGIDAGGRPLDPLMPRFDLSREDLESLVGYLGSLSSPNDPGVEPERLHFATVVHEDADPVARRSMLDVLQVFFSNKRDQWMRASLRESWRDQLGVRYQGEPIFRAVVQTRTRARKTGRGWLAVDRDFRDWVLHVWELKGAPESWRAQLEAHYAEQPVLAMISGMTGGPWQPIHEFCAGFEIPCLLPNTDVPPADEEHFSLYFNRGTALEAQVLARHWRDSGMNGAVLQVYRRETPGEAAATALEQAAKGGDIRIQTRSIDPGQAPSPALWQDLVAGGQVAAAALWLGEKDLADLGDPPVTVDRVFLSSSLGLDAVAAAPRRQARTYLIHPFDLRAATPGWVPPRIQEWLRNWGVEPGDARIQANTYFASSVLSGALSEMGDRISREYLLEMAEDRLDRAVTDSLFPRVSLGPGQRFASKGAYILNANSQQPSAETGWIVP